MFSLCTSINDINNTCPYEVLPIMNSNGNSRRIILRRHWSIQVSSLFGDVFPAVYINLAGDQQPLSGNSVRVDLWGYGSLSS